MSVRDSCSIRALFETSAPEGKLNLENTNRDNIINLPPSTAFSPICKSKRVWLRWTRGRSTDQRYSPSRHSLTSEHSPVGSASFPLLNGANWQYLLLTVPFNRTHKNTLFHSKKNTGPAFTWVRVNMYDFSFLPTGKGQNKTWYQWPALSF